MLLYKLCIHVRMCLYFTKKYMRIRANTYLSLVFEKETSNLQVCASMPGKYIHTAPLSLTYCSLSNSNKLSNNVHVSLSTFCKDRLICMLYVCAQRFIHIQTCRWLLCGLGLAGGASFRDLQDPCLSPGMYPWHCSCRPSPLPAAPSAHLRTCLHKPAGIRPVSQRPFQLAWTRHCFSPLLIDGVLPLCKRRQELHTSSSHLECFEITLDSQ